MSSLSESKDDGDMIRFIYAAAFCVMLEEREKNLRLAQAASIALCVASKSGHSEVRIIATLFD